MRHQTELRCCVLSSVYLPMSILLTVLNRLSRKCFSKIENDACTMTDKVQSNALASNRVIRANKKFIVYLDR
jgi:hypothetical protein